MASSISFEELLLLDKAGAQFLSEHDYGAVDLENVMNEVLGPDRSIWDAKEWQKYWNALEAY